ncbi:hypothetical protein C8F01DRAFT_398495 [Mycena amicta]|nr:hypothetical protein C8F01DRAFT_398495 [Mycena amicta]
MEIPAQPHPGFYHFRLAQPLPPHLAAHVNASAPGPAIATNLNETYPTTSVSVGQTRATKAPYGSGDDDAYTLVFPDLAAFIEWKEKEEETNVVEFVKGDTHGSKAVPPRFKEHTKLVCARHSRSGRKKYVKKHPERVRKVPSRKLDGKGCGASISFKTYFDTEEVRVCYISEHSHEIGPANLPFTRRGRKLALQQDGRKGKKATPDTSMDSNPGPSTSNQPPNPSISMLGPVPIAPGMYPAPWQQGTLTQDRWENMTTLFQTVRAHARTFEYPMPSVAILESVLFRLYLESPVSLGVPGTVAAAAATATATHDPNIQPNLGESSPSAGSGDEA